MKGNDHLFELIKNLTPNEKRYFRIFAKQHSGVKKNNYTRLFEALEKQQEYTEEYLKKKFGKEAFYKQVAVTKNHLFHLILKSLRSFHSENSPYQQMLEKLSGIEILFNKSLMNECEKEISQLEKLALAYENDWVLSELYFWKARVRMSFSKEEGDDVESLEKSGTYLNHRLSEIHIRTKTRAFYKHIRKKGGSKTPEIREEITQLMNSPEFVSPEKAETFMGKLTSLSILSYYHSLNNNKKQTTLVFEQFIKLYEEKKERISANIFNYLLALKNLGLAYLFEERFAECRRIAEKIVTLKPSYSANDSARVNVWINAYYVYLETMRLMSLKNWREGYERKKEFLGRIQRVKTKIGAEDLASILFNLACFCFYNKEYRECAQLLNELQQLVSKNLRQDIASFSRFLQIMLLFETKAYEQMVYAIKNLEIFLSKNNLLFDTEKLTLAFFKKIIRDPDLAVKGGINFLNDLAALSKSTVQRHTNLHLAIDFRQWLLPKEGLKS